MAGPKPTISFVDDAVRVALPHHPLARPRLQIGSARGGWIRLSLDGRTLAYARQDAHRQGLAWLRVADGRGLALAPPLTSALARSTRRAGWASHFARAVFSGAASPVLSAGVYALAPTDASRPPTFRVLAQPLAAPARLLGPNDAHAQPRAAALSWLPSGAHRSNVLALREPSSAEASRVKAWRKHARTGTLPPALLLWISALDAYVVLDGHDRLYAAAIERVAPTAVSLHPVSSRVPAWCVDRSEVDRRDVEVRYERAFLHEHALSLGTRLALNEALAWSSAPWVALATTTARSEPDLAARFEIETRDLVLPEDVRRIFAR